ncbi:alpha/beta fold hydrolase [Meridianimarinicoccus sp. RP-17]|uniref:alpha/beta fold hydrolase n=1 Tax=Meridianimarinicoccus zhengii TaxID=2056810 RepID=UPI001F338514|nr:alpha/beta hydrolase [Phycocomes zhengii]
MKSVASFAAALAVAAGMATHFRAGAREAAAEAAWPPAGQLLDVGGVKVHAHVSGSGPDVVLIHGAGGSLRDFTFDLVGRLEDRYRVIAFDRPGHGWTDMRDTQGQPFDSPQAQATLLQAAARQLDVHTPIVLGHSFGGSVAMAWAVTQPDTLAGVVLLAGASMPWPGTLNASYRVNANPLGAAVVVPLITAWAPLSYAETVLAGIFAPQPMPDGYADHFGLPMAMRRDILRANARQVNGLRPHVVALSERYPLLSLPVELVHGTADTIVPLAVHSGPLAALVPGANLTALEGVGHMPHHSDPAAAVAAIDRAAARAGLR